MTYDEVKSRVSGLVSDPDTASESAVALLSDLEKDYTTMDSMTKQHETDEERIRNLQDTNQRLFLSVTGVPEEEPEEKEPEPGIDWNAILEDKKDGE